MERNFFSAFRLEANLIKFPQHDLSQCFLFYSCWSRPTVQWHKCVWVRESVKSWAEEETGWLRRKDDSRCSRGAGFSSHIPGLFSCTTSVSPDVSLQSNHCMWMCVCMFAALCTDCIWLCVMFGSPSGSICCYFSPSDIMGITSCDEYVVNGSREGREKLRYPVKYMRRPNGSGMRGTEWKVNGLNQPAAPPGCGAPAASAHSAGLDYHPVNVHEQSGTEVKWLVSCLRHH